MGKHGKGYRGAAEKIGDEPLDLGDGVKLAKECAYAKFDESLEVAMRLGVDPKHADQMVRGTVARRSRRPKRPAPTRWGARSSPRRSRTVGSTSTPWWRHPT